MEGSENKETVKGRISIGLVEDQFLFKEGIKAILLGWPEIEVIFESADGHSVIQKLKSSNQLPHVMLVDLSLPADGTKEFNGLDLTRALREEFPKLKILVLSVYDDPHFIAQLIKKGAHGYLVKDSSPQEVYNAINAIYTNGMYINETTLKAIQNDANNKVILKPQARQIDHVTLTRREEEILNLICQQKTTDEIAEQLFISPKTVNGHRNNLLQKTNSRNVAGLVTFALGRKQQ